MFKYKELENKNWLSELYIVERKTQKEIASIIGCTSWSIKNALKKHNIPTRTIKESGLLRYERKPKVSKYPLLEDKEWLYKMAIVERKTYREIKDLVGAKGEQHVIQAIKKHGFYERRRLCPRVVDKSNYEILNNVKWLYSKYIDEKLSTLEIAKIVGCKCGSVQQAIHRFGLKIRSKIESHESKRHRDGKEDGFELNKETMFIINGGLLGDAGLKTTHDSKTASVAYSKTSIHKDYLEYECEKVLGHCEYVRFVKTRDPEGRLCFGKYYAKKSYVFTTLAHKELNPIFFKWYKQIDGKNIKIIPKDIEINEDTLLHWFMDDGYSYYVNKKWKTLDGEHSRKYARIYLCTQSFQKEELDALCNKIKCQFGLTFYPRFHKRKKGVSQGSGYELELSIKNVKQFFEVIGPCPVPSMEYKWKLDK
jgi:uncharacterized OsmC-like protein